MLIRIKRKRCDAPTDALVVSALLMGRCLHRYRLHNLFASALASAIKQAVAMRLQLK